MQIYWDYILDMLKAFKARGNQSHFTFSHLSVLSHQQLHLVAYQDRPFHNFLERLFRGGHHENSLIILYSDHALRFGSGLNTTANLYEQRLPFFYIRVPDSLSLGGLNASQLREVVRANQHRLTSHLDVHATMMHVLR